MRAQLADLRRGMSPAGTALPHLRLTTASAATSRLRGAHQRGVSRSPFKHPSLARRHASEAMARHVPAPLRASRYEGGELSRKRIQGACARQPHLGGEGCRTSPVAALECRGGHGGPRRPCSTERVAPASPARGLAGEDDLVLHVPEERLYGGDAGHGRRLGPGQLRGGREPAHQPAAAPRVGAQRVAAGEPGQRRQRQPAGEPRARNGGARAGGGGPSIGGWGRLLASGALRGGTSCR